MAMLWVRITWVFEAYFLWAEHYLACLFLVVAQFDDLAIGQRVFLSFSLAFYSGVAGIEQNFSFIFFTN